jgi:type IV pilus assembly protein PilA
MVIKHLFENFSEETIRLFLGKNSHYYLEKWKKMLQSNSKISWNWPAFFFGFWWFFYRKMYLYGFFAILYEFFFIPIFSIILTILIAFIFQSSALIFISFILSRFLAYLPISLFANYIYARFVYINLGKAKLWLKNEEEIKKFASGLGGVNNIVVFVALFIVFAIFFLIPIIASISIPNYLKYREKALVASYAEPLARGCAMDIVIYCLENPNEKDVNPNKLSNCEESFKSPDGATIYLDVPSFSCSSDGAPEPIQVIARHSMVDRYVSICNVSTEGIKCFIEEMD